MFAAPVLATSPKQAEVKQLLDNGEKVLVYFDQKMGGEISVSPTRSSPEIAFDTTFVEITGGSTGLRLERFAILEIQTMDFHGSYRKAVDNLSSALRLHDDEFPKQVQKNSRWLGERIEGPNIANVFKRTFWQLMFKFEMATSPGCSGVALAMPVAVWDSWQRFLGAPQLTQIDDALFRLQQPDSNSEPESSWIYIFDLQSGIRKTPSPLFIQKIVRTTASALAHHALDEAPKGAMNQLRLGIYPALRNRIRKFWPISVDIPLEQPTVPTVKIDEAPGDIDELRDSK
ncbi:MAG TPA: hypothetical protein VE422_42465 [Terriglobia bacterium]|nr:hypothetical protein [Terriglobia bacterium]